MKIRGLVILFSLSLSVGTVFSQAMVSDSGSGVTYLNKNEGSKGLDDYKRGYYVGPHVLGDTITMLLNRFETDYVYYIPGDGAYAVTEKKIIKPIIYKAIKRVNKYYEKSVDKNKVSEAVAYGKMKMILNKGIRLRDYYTEKVEADLKKMKDPVAIEEYLSKIEFR